MLSGRCGSGDHSRMMGNSSNRTEERGHRLVDHTADVILEAWGPGIAQCLEEAAAGFCEIFAVSDARGEPVEFRVSVDDPDELVPGVLEEIVFLLDTTGGIPVGADVAVADVDTASGSIRVAPPDAVEVVGPAPKAVSRSGSRLLHTDAGWECRVTVDV